MNTFGNNKVAIDHLFKEYLSPFINEEEYLKRIKQIADDYDRTLKKDNDDNWSGSIFRRIFNVHERVILVEHLHLAKVTEAQDSFLRGYMYPSLCTYLLLTCFDNLGQPSSGFIFFPDWVVSRRKAQEVDRVLATNDYKIASSKKDFIAGVYRDYHSVYGIKNSFYRFLDEIIPISQQNKLFDNIMFELPVDEEEPPNFSNGTIAEKKRWLYSTRNNYTHNLSSPENHYKQLIKYNGKDWEIREVVYKPTYKRILLANNFNEILKETIFVGIVEVIKNNSSI